MLKQSIYSFLQLLLLVFKQSIVVLKVTHLQQQNKMTAFPNISPYYFHKQVDRQIDRPSFRVFGTVR